MTDNRLPVTGNGGGTGLESSSPVTDDSDALDSDEVYNSTAGQLITVVSAAAAAMSASLSQ